MAEGFLSDAENSREIALKVESVMPGESDEWIVFSVARAAEARAQTWSACSAS